MSYMLQQESPTIVGITGMSGSGKTTVAKILKEAHAYVIDADQVAHSTMKKDRDAYREIVEAFGTVILDDEGEINRSVLGEIVFDDKEKLAQLEGIIHPKVKKLIGLQIYRACLSGYDLIVLDAALLVESGLRGICNSVWLITADHDVKLARIMARDNITKEAAEKRLANRVSDEALKPYASIALDNNGNDLDFLKSVAFKALEIELDALDALEANRPDESELEDEE